MTVHAVSGVEGDLAELAGVHPAPGEVLVLHTGGYRRQYILSRQLERNFRQKNNKNGNGPYEHFCHSLDQWTLKS